MKEGRLHDSMGNDDYHWRRRPRYDGTRFISFVLFAKSEKPPAIVTYLGDMLPAAVMGLLVVYSLKGVSLSVAPNGISEAIALVILAAVHYWRRNLLLSIAVGTIVYMFLVQEIF